MDIRGDIPCGTKRSICSKVEPKSIVRTRDVAEARESLNRVYCPLDLTVPRADSLNARLVAVELSALTLGRLHFGSDVKTWASSIEDYYVMIALSGRAVNTWAGTSRAIATLPGTAAVFAPGTSGGIAWSRDCTQLCLKIRPDTVRREIEMMLDRPVESAVVFPPSLNVATPAATTWLSLVRALEHDAGRPEGILGHRLAMANMQHLLVQGLLLSQPHTYAEELGRRIVDHSGGKTVNQAIDAMQAHPERPWTTGELARETGVSARALQLAFVDAGKTPPMTYLRQLRLRHVRAELTDDSLAPMTVADVARKWGFVHLGRFANYYRELFGETPSQTLRGSR